MAAIYSGKNARVFVSPNTFLEGTKWTITDKVEEADLTCFELPRFPTLFPSRRDCEISIEGFWADDLASYPPHFKAGEIISLKIWIDSVNLPNRYFRFSQVFVLSVTTEAEARGMVKVILTGKNQSTTFYFPGEIPAET